MAKLSIYDEFLAREGVALLEFRGGGVFRPLAALPKWVDELWQTKRSKRLKLAEQSPFLENFLGEAEDFWDAKKPGSVNSGNWIERDGAGKQVPMEASAFWLGGKRVVAIRNLSGTFTEQQQLYQTARDSLLTHERLMREVQKKEILLHCIIHDLSQPLTSMRGCFDLLLSKKVAPEIAKFLLTGQRESQRQERMIRGILEAFSGDLPNAQNQKQEAAESADLISCERRAVEQFTAAFMERGVELLLAPYKDSDRDWRVVGDSGRIDRIFGNLLENALRYSKGGGQVTVGAVDEGDRVMAFVDDEGPGLPADSSHEHMFALFVKGKDRPGKAGLGLYFCRMTVERWGGEIGAENRPDGGSRFWFRLPRAKQASNADRPVEGAKAKADSDEHVPLQKATKPLRVLVADDNDTVRDFAVELLRSRGHQTTAVTDGITALAALDEASPDVILLDQEMPGMTGVDTARAIREKEHASAKRRALIVGVSGNGSEEHRRLALEAGMDAFLTKPFDRNELFRTVESKVSNDGKPTESGAAEAAKDGDLRAHLREMTGGNEKILKKLIANFLSDTPKKMAAIRRAVSSKDSLKLAETAHSLRGALAIFGAQKSIAARNLEMMGKEKRLEEAPREFGVLSEEIRRLEKQLQALEPAKAAKARKTARR